MRVEKQTNDVALVLPRLTMTIMRAAKVGDSLLVEYHTPRVNRYAETNAVRLGMKFRQRTVIVVDPVTCEVRKALILIRES